MAVPKSILQARGLWHGKYLLNLPWLPPEKRVSESNTRLHIETGERDSYATITYDWKHDGKRQEGTIVLCKPAKSKAVEFGWVDSWHENSQVLHLTGEESEDGSVKGKGTYAAGKETWGWTVGFLLTGEQFTMSMTNVDPAGRADWAVKATYSRD